MDRLPFRRWTIFAGGRALSAVALVSSLALAEANPYDTEKGYYNTKGAYADHNSDAVKARVDGLPGAQAAAGGAAELLRQQEDERKKNTANCPKLADCQVAASRLPASFAETVNAREETYKGGIGNTGLVGLDEKLVEVERIAGFGQGAAQTAALNIEMKIAGMQGGAYENPNTAQHAAREALREEMEAQTKTATAFGISADWANRGYRSLIENPNDSPAMGNGNVATPDAGTAKADATAARAPGEISNTGAGPNGKPAEGSSGTTEVAKGGAPGNIDNPQALGASALEQGRQMAYDILKAEGIAPAGSLREVALQRGDVAEAGNVKPGELKRPGELGAPANGKAAEAADRAIATMQAAAKARAKRNGVAVEDDEVTGPGLGRGAKPRRAAFRSVAPFDDEEPPPAMLRGLSAADLKDVKLKWKLFRLTQERERVLREAGPMIAKLRSLGVKATTHGQSIFQVASSNYRTFHRWRKPSDRSASVTAKRPAALTAQR